MTDASEPPPGGAKVSGKSVRSVAKASIKEAIGKLTGDVKAEAEGKAEKRSSSPTGRSGSAHPS